MNRRLSALSTTTALFATLTAAAAPVQDTALAQDVSPEIVSAMQRDLSLTPEQARRRLASEAAATGLEKSLRSDLGETFGGAWMNEDGSRLVVAVTHEAAAEYVRSTGAEARLVARSARQLDTVKAALDRNARRAGRDIHAWYVDVTTNTVVVLAKDPGLTSVKSFVAAGNGAVRVVASAEEPRPFYDTRGGDAYYPPGVRCSIGFPVNGGFVTAGHCGGAGGATVGFNGVSQGTIRGSSFPGNDYAWVQTNGSWTSQPWVYNYNGGNVLVLGSAEAPIGSSVCRSGSTTGWRCGVIQARNVTINYAAGPVYEAVQTNVCAEGGDSGGSFISGNQAQGVTSGGTGNCSTGGTTFYQPVNEILAVYGLTLRTGGRAIVSNFNGKCIDIPNSNTTDGTPLQMWDCNGTGAQSWTFYSDGTVRALGKCMDVAWGSRDNGAVIQLVGCNGNPAQHFVLSGAGDLVNPQANKCIDIKDWNSASGARLQLWDCSGNSNQKWFLR